MDNDLCRACSFAVIEEITADTICGTIFLASFKRVYNIIRGHLSSVLEFTFLEVYIITEVDGVGQAVITDSVISCQTRNHLFVILIPDKQGIENIVHNVVLVHG